MKSTKRRRTVTQRDIAEMANVSQATVSRVLTGEALVDAETADRVARVMKDLNYRPDAAARNLRHRNSGLIGLVVKREPGALHDDPFFANLISDIIDELIDTEFHLCVEIASESVQSSVYDDLLRTRRVDGLILVESQAKDDRIGKLQADNFPFVLIGNPEGNPFSHSIYSVDNDNREASFLATQHLIENGFRRIGFLAGPAGVTVSEDRVAGYTAALALANLNEPIIAHAEFGLAGALKAAETMLSQTHAPDAIVVMDDYMAMGAMIAARRLRKSIPADIGLVSFNDSAICEALDGGLTSVNLNIREIVKVAVNILMNLINEDSVPGENRRFIVPTELSVRQSTRKRAGSVGVAG